MEEVVRMVRVSANVAGLSPAPVDPGRVREGSPQQQLLNAFSNSKGNFHCGVWASSAGCWEIRYTEDEFCYLIEGEAVITDAAGAAQTVRAGDAFVIPAGFSGTWRTIGSARKFYSVYEEP